MQRQLALVETPWRGGLHTAAAKMMRAAALLPPSRLLLKKARWQWLPWLPWLMWLLWLSWLPVSKKRRVRLQPKRGCKTVLKEFL